MWLKNERFCILVWQGHVQKNLWPMEKAKKRTVFPHMDSFSNQLAQQRYDDPASSEIKSDSWPSINAMLRLACNNLVAFTGSFSQPVGVSEPPFATPAFERPQSVKRNAVKRRAKGPSTNPLPMIGRTVQDCKMTRQHFVHYNTEAANLSTGCCNPCQQSEQITWIMVHFLLHWFPCTFIRLTSTTFNNGGHPYLRIFCLPRKSI